MDWTPQAQPDPLSLTANQTVFVRAAARDAYGHTSPPSAPHGITRDATPPPPLDLVSAEGYRTLRLTWAPCRDDLSGPHAVVLQRVLPTPTTWRLPAQATAHEDTGLRLGQAPTYALSCEDRAGNASPATTLQPDYEGLRPHASLRASKTWWGAGIQHFHADFDRPMPTHSAPRLVLAVANQEWNLEGAWLSNRTTYAARLADSHAYPAGPATLRLTQALGENGHGLHEPAAIELRIDHEPPRLVLPEPVRGWVNASPIRVAAVDDQDPQPSLRYRAWEPGQPPTPAWTNASSTLQLAVPKPGLQVRVTARDAAGNAAPEIQRTYHVDDQPPYVQGVRWLSDDRIELRLADDASGLQPNATRWALEAGPWNAAAPDDAGRLRLDLPPGTRRLHLEAADRVQNVNRSWVELEPAPPPRLEPTRPATWTREAPLGGEGLAPGPAGIGQLVLLVPAWRWAALGGVLLTGAAVVVRVARRARPFPRPSLARRIRSMRAAPFTTRLP